MECRPNDCHLSSDMIFEILSRSCLKTVARCRLLSRDCNLLTYDSSFMNLHSQRTQTLSGFFLQTTKYCKDYSTFVSPENLASNYHVSLDFLPSPVKIEAAASAQGILVCVDQTWRRIPTFYVCKPCTKEWQVIPNPKTRYSTIRIGILVLRSNPLHYKIVRFSKPKFCNFRKFYKCHRLRCEIFDSLTRNWRQLEEVRLRYGVHLTHTPTVSACGKLNWLTDDHTVLSFDADKEEYSIFSLPSSVKDCDSFDVLLTEYEGKLAVTCRKAMSSLDLWVMEIYDHKIWRKRQKISIEYLSRKVGHTYPIAFYNADIAVMEGCYQVMFFKFKNENSSGDHMVKLGNWNGILRGEGVFPFRSDFKLCNLKNECWKKQKKSVSWKEYLSRGWIGLWNSTNLSLLVLILFLFFCFCCFPLLSSV